MTPENEINLTHQVDKIDDDLTRLQERVSSLDALVKERSIALEELRKATDAELKKHWSAIMHLVVALETLEEWSDMTGVQARVNNAPNAFKRFKELLAETKKIFGP